METKTYYTCLGKIRIPCRIDHTTLETAQKCLEKDRVLCRRYCGESDRYIVYWNGLDFEPVEALCTD